MKDGFIAVASHELRTPLTSMRGSLGLLQGGVAGDLSDEAQGLVSIAMQNCERLVRLVNDLLDLEKITSGHGAFRIALLDWPAVLDQAIASSRGFVESYGVRFELEKPPELRVRGDEDRLIQVLSNLLFNAAKFSPRGSVVTVSSKPLADSWVRTSVRDRGPGVPEHFRSRVFQRFAQADMGEDRRAEGSGLGLAISREIVERLGGRIGFDDAPGGGTVFWFDLPGTVEVMTA
jgi:signal transduction histidine kinase